ncbi:ABC-type transport system involved in multi-copper enzyme maturation permease subunit [Aneurinibacillus soli]|uniref:ABC-2 family transporter protein n=1 Tax=Aneurinibacillus soli TaxID=1500254 RepID=A0A0U5C6X2_9BACL|nr:ABC transporter permease subunit [Aneurinibacillus soli]PYE58175.1 ABC-type transport system involved in multi-copper enzyme maturation permease subunit [Aneurinibacillus soli]BAU27891.1 ABC-2 family transporter protein [Aneurinibacillus soli]
MNMRQLLVNPVLSKEFRVRMRSQKTPWIISLYLAALAIVVFTVMYFSTKNQPGYQASSSQGFFLLLSALQYGLIIFATPGLTAGVISGERERQTLSLLLTTNLSAWQIIIGKWMSSLSFMMLLVLASMPLYSLVLLFGSVSPLQMMQTFGVYFVTMLSIGAMGVLMSTLIKRTGAAAVATYSVVFAYTTLLSIVTWIMMDSIQDDLQAAAQTTGHMANISTHPLFDWLNFLVAINPVNAVVYVFLNEKWMIGDVTIHEMMFHPYTTFIVFYAILTVLILALASFLIRRIQIRP